MQNQNQSSNQEEVVIKTFTDYEIMRMREIEIANFLVFISKGGLQEFAKEETSYIGYKLSQLLLKLQSKLLLFKESIPERLEFKEDLSFSQAGFSLVKTDKNIYPASFSDSFIKAKERSRMYAQNSKTVYCVYLTIEDTFFICAEEEESIFFEDMKHRLAELYCYNPFSNTDAEREF